MWLNRSQSSFFVLVLVGKQRYHRVQTSRLSGYKAFEFQNVLVTRYSRLLGNKPKRAAVRWGYLKKASSSPKWQSVRIAYIRLQSNLLRVLFQVGRNSCVALNRDIRVQWSLSIVRACSTVITCLVETPFRRECARAKWKYLISCLTESDSLSAMLPPRKQMMVI